MKLTLRQRIGIALVAASLVAAIAIQIATGELVQVTAEENRRDVGRHISSQMFVATVFLSWRYALPLAACAVCGFFLALLPSRPGNTAL